MNPGSPPSPSFPPPPENGLHTWLLQAAWHCRKTGVSADDAAARLTGYDGQLRRRFQAGEVADAVAKAYGARPAEASRPYSRLPFIPPWNAAETARLHHSLRATTADLTALSADREPKSYHPRTLLEKLFPDPDGLICIGESAFRFKTARLRDHRHYREKQLIVPAYMTAEYGKTAAGKRSMHAKSNTGPPRYIVCDFDEPPPEQQPSIILHLMAFRRPAIVLSSGGKSLHAWFPVTDPAGDRLFWTLCIALGADPALQRNPSQFVRLPNGTRDNGTRQTLLYFDPAALTSLP